MVSALCGKLLTASESPQTSDRINTGVVCKTYIDVAVAYNPYLIRYIGDLSEDFYENSCVRFLGTIIAASQNRNEAHELGGGLEAKAILDTRGDVL